jgi:hypothetical protein
MQKNQNLDFGVFNLNTFPDTNFSKQKRFNLFQKNTLGYLKLFLSLQTPFATSCPIWRSSFFKKTGGWNEDFIVKTDPELHTRILLNFNPAFSYFKNAKPDSFYRLHDDVTKKKYITKAAVFYRIKYIRNAYKLIQEQSFFPKHPLEGALRKGVLIFYKTYFINAATQFQQEYFEFLDWAKKQKLINRYYYSILYYIGVAKNSNSYFYKKMHVAGILYRLL